MAEHSYKEGDLVQFVGGKGVPYTVIGTHGGWLWLRDDDRPAPISTEARMVESVPEPEPEPKPKRTLLGRPPAEGDDVVSLGSATPPVKVKAVHREMVWLNHPVEMMTVPADQVRVVHRPIRHLWFLVAKPQTGGQSFAYTMTHEKPHPEWGMGPTYIGVIKIDGHTLELSWEHGGPLP